MSAEAAVLQFDHAQAGAVTEAPFEAKPVKQGTVYQYIHARLHSVPLCELGGLAIFETTFADQSLKFFSPKLTCGWHYWLQACWRYRSCRPSCSPIENLFHPVPNTLSAIEAILGEQCHSIRAHAASVRRLGLAPVYVHMYAYDLRHALSSICRSCECPLSVGGLLGHSGFVGSSCNQKQPQPEA